MKLTIEVWRQENPDVLGFFEEHAIEGAQEEMSLLELIDYLNDQLVSAGREPIAYDSDCREVFAAPAELPSMMNRTGRCQTRRPVASICVLSRTGRSYGWSRFDLRRFPW